MQIRLSSFFPKKSQFSPKSPLTLLFSFMDFFILFIFMAVTVASFMLLGRTGPAKSVLIITSGEKEYAFSLAQDRLLEIDGAIGKSVIEIQDGRAFFKDSPCKNKICVHTGAVSGENDWAACLPNDVFIRVN